MGAWADYMDASMVNGSWDAESRYDTDTLTAPGDLRDVRYMQMIEVLSKASAAKHKAYCFSKLPSPASSSATHRGGRAASPSPSTCAAARQNVREAQRAACLPLPPPWDQVRSDRSVSCRTYLSIVGPGRTSGSSRT